MTAEPIPKSSVAASPADLEVTFSYLAPGDTDPSWGPGRSRSPRRPPVGRGGLAATVRGLAQAARRGRLPAGGQPAPVRRLARPGRRHRRPRAGAGGHRPHRRRRGRTRPARRAENLDTAAVLPDRRAGRRRRLAEPDLEFRAFCARKGLPASSTRNWSGPGTHGGPSDTSAARPASGRATPTTRSGHADHTPACPRSGNWTPQRCSRLDCYRHPKKASHGPGRRTRTRLARRRRARFAVTVR